MDSTEVICAVRDDDDGPVVEAAVALGDALGVPTRLVHVAAPVIGPEGLVAGATSPVLPVTAGGVANAAVALTPPPDLSKLAAGAGRPDLACDVVEGTAVDVLRELGASDRCGWLVVGDAGRGTFGAMLHGSVARRLLDVPGRPLVVVPRAGRRTPSTGTEPVACLVGDGRLTGSAPLAGRLAGALQTHVVLVHARAARTTDAEVERDFAAARAHLEPLIAVEEVAVAGSHLAAVPETCRAAGARLLVLDRATRGAFGAAVLPSLTHELVADADLLVVVARDEDDPTDGG